MLAAYGVVAAFFYGTIMNLWFWPFATGNGTGLSYVAGAPLADNLHRFLVFDVATSLGWDTGRAITNAVAIIVLGRPCSSTLRRAARKAAFEAPVVFEPPRPDALAERASGGRAEASRSCRAGRVADSKQHGQVAHLVAPAVDVLLDQVVEIGRDARVDESAQPRLGHPHRGAHAPLAGCVNSTVVKSVGSVMVPNTSQRKANRLIGSSGHDHAVADLAGRPGEPDRAADPEVDLGAVTEPLGDRGRSRSGRSRPPTGSPRP